MNRTFLTQEAIASYCLEVRGINVNPDQMLCLDGLDEITCVRNGQAIALSKDALIEFIKPSTSNYKFFGIEIASNVVAEFFHPLGSTTESAKLWQLTLRHLPGAEANYLHEYLFQNQLADHSRIVEYEFCHLQVWGIAQSFLTGLIGSREIAS
ncbi:MAG: hypothetical protein KME17_23765 [Cyanosarcina radialis HA8281-LM2]|jgi:hypothetical protein|nr:hypothetical protein [Cyanosarcina radialis HA8281-LM2]